MDEESEGERGKKDSKKYEQQTFGRNGQIHLKNSVLEKDNSLVLKNSLWIKHSYIQSASALCPPAQPVSPEDKLGIYNAHYLSGDL